MRMESRRSVLVALIGVSALVLAGCKIVPIAEERKEAASQAFDAKAYAAGLWTPKVLPYFADNARPIAAVLAAIAADPDAAGKSFGYRPPGGGSPWTFIVTGTGAVTAKNTESRAGTLTIQPDGVAAPVSLQIGPVVRGTAIRDSLPFVSFEQFTNQLEFADASKALTALAVAAAAPNVPAIKVGDKVKFTGAFSLDSKTGPVQITPIDLVVVP